MTLKAKLENLLDSVPTKEYKVRKNGDCYYAWYNDVLIFRANSRSDAMKQCWTDHLSRNNISISRLGYDFAVNVTVSYLNAFISSSARNGSNPQVTSNTINTAWLTVVRFLSVTDFTVGALRIYSGKDIACSLGRDLWLETNGDVGGFTAQDYSIAKNVKDSINNLIHDITQYIKKADYLKLKPKQSNGWLHLN